MRVFVYHGFDKFSGTRDGNGDLISDGRNESLGIVTDGVSAEKEEAREEELMFIAQLCDSLRDGRLPSPSGTVEPYYEGLGVDFPHDPVHDLLQDGFAGVFVALRWITAL
jgi:hypothetical protein